MPVSRKAMLIKLYLFLWCALWCYFLLEHGFELIRYALLAVFLVIPACSTAQTEQSSLRNSLQEYIKKIGLVFYDAKNPKLCKLSLFFFFSFCLYTTILLCIDGSSLRLVRNWFTFYIIGAGAVYYLGWDAVKYIVVALAIGVLLSFVGLFLHSYFPEVELFAYMQDINSSRLSLYMPHPNNLGVLLGWGCCLLCYCRLNSILIIHKIIDFILLVAMFIIICLTSSRTGLLSSIITIFAMIFIFKFKYFKKIFIAILCMIAVFYMLRYVIIQQIPINNRFVSILNNPIQDSTVKSRMVIWDITLKFIAQKPLTGNGPHSFTKMYNEYLAEHLSELQQKYKNIEMHIHQAHNLVLAVLSDMGAIGLFLFLITLCLWFYAALKCPPPYNLGAFAIMFSMLVGLAEYSLYIGWMSALLFGSCGSIFIRHKDAGKTYK